MDGASAYGKSGGKSSIPGRGIPPPPAGEEGVPSAVAHLWVRPCAAILRP